MVAERHQVRGAVRHTGAENFFCDIFAIAASRNVSALTAPRSEFRAHRKSIGDSLGDHRPKACPANETKFTVEDKIMATDNCGASRQTCEPLASDTARRDRMGRLLMAHLFVTLAPERRIPGRII